MFQRILLLFVTVILFACPQIGAQTGRSPQAAMAHVDTALFNGLRYRLVGPSRGGRVTTVTGVPSQPKTFYMGVASGGRVKVAPHRPASAGLCPTG